MLPPSSPIAFPPSSSPPAIIAGRKRSIPADDAADLKRRLKKRGSPLSLRDPNRQDNRGSWICRQEQELPVQEISRRKIQGPFAEDEEDDNDDSKAPSHRPAEEASPAEHLSPTPLAIEPSIHAKQMHATSSSGQKFQVKEKHASLQLSFKQMIEERSSARPGRANKSHYGVEIHQLLEAAAEASHVSSEKLKADDVVHPSIEPPLPSRGAKRGRTSMWTEKYRARKFTDLVGDERTHRDVLRWVKHWDPIVFAGSSKSTSKSKSGGDPTEEKSYSKILLLTGPPGLGKTTLAHVCARQAGYEVVEINASDERSRDVVKGKIRDLVGTENVRGVQTKTSNGTVRRAGRPVCVIVDEVDGVVGGSGGDGDGGFFKALIELVALDKKNSEFAGKSYDHRHLKRNRKGDRFRLLRPIILICNDVYHPALRSLRSSGIAEIIHVRKPPMDKVVARLRFVFENEGIPCDNDSIRRLCEATWGVSSSRESRSTLPSTGEGDIRGLLVVGEWVAARLRAQKEPTITSSIRLTRQWIQQYMLKDLSLNGSASRSLGRGGAKEVMERIFQDNAGYPRESNLTSAVGNLPVKIVGSHGVSEASKNIAVGRLRDLVETSGDCDRIMTHCFAAYASQPFQDDTLLTKPAAAYDWLQFHDSLSSRIFTGQEWELTPYLSQAALGFHLLFASAPKHSWASEQTRLENDDEKEPIPFLGPRADYEASEAHKQNKTILQAFQSSLAPPLLRCFRSIEDITTGLLPCLIRILTPDVKPVIVGGSGEQKGIVSVRKGEERKMIERAVKVMPDVGVTFERSRVDPVQGGGRDYVYRMEPPVDTLTSFETATCGGPASSTTRYAIRQALDQEYQKFIVGQRPVASQAWLGSDSNAMLRQGATASKQGCQSSPNEKGSGQLTAPKRDFFGRIIKENTLDLDQTNRRRPSADSNDRASSEKKGGRVFVSFHEGYSNAVRKPITLDDLLKGL
ncbi:MAG: hypothetical protein Q9223_002742 [Gallowayella weberi]